MDGAAGAVFHDTPANSRLCVNLAFEIWLLLGVNVATTYPLLWPRIKANTLVAHLFRPSLSLA